MIGDEMRGWVALAFGGDKNAYNDEPGSSYAFDDTVQHHKQVQVGDVLFLRNRIKLEGIGKVSRIETRTDIKQFLRCPTCGDRHVHRRTTKTLRFKCANGHEFADAKVVQKNVKTFRAVFDGDFISIPVTITAPELRPFQLRKSRQLAIMPVDLDALSSYVAGRFSAAMPTINFWLGDLAKLDDRAADELVSLTPEGEDYRRRAFRSIRLRRGQLSFREELIDRYSSTCVISNCQVLSVLEAAHLRPYRGDGDNHPSNGLLLRSDLHVLFDLNLIGIDPVTFKISCSKRLKNTEYGKYDGKQLPPEISKMLDPKALVQRWSLFVP
jgi:hypothetical protein